MSERILSAETWPEEAQAAINDIKSHVKRAEISKRLKSNDHRIYINLKTLEDRDYCIEMTTLGFKIVGHKFDDMNLVENENQQFETPYALLDSISEGYRKSFSGELMSKLVKIAQDENRT